MAKKPSSNIVLYPMLTDTGLSTSTIVLTSKALERFLLIYDVESIMTSSKRGGVNYQLKGKKLYIKEDVETLQEKDPSKTGDPFEQPEVPLLPGDPDVIDAEYEVLGDKPKEKEKEKEKKKEKEKPVRVRYTPDAKTDMVSISAEPTYTTVTSKMKDGVERSVFLGVKVFPVPVQSSYDLVSTLVSDYGRRKVEAIFVRVGRMVQRKMWKLLSRILPFTRRQISGQSRDSIIIPRTKYSRVFCLINYINLDKDIFRDPGLMSKLFSLGWESIVIADEVQKTLYFCMKEFGGLCSVVPYAIMRATIGKQQKEAFESLEDIRSSSTALFRLKKRSTILGEHVVNSKLQKYKIFEGKKMSDKLLESYLQELEQTDSKLASYSKKITKPVMTKIIGDLKSAEKSGDMKKIVSIVKRVSPPKIAISKLSSTVQKRDPNFNKSFQLANKILSNSFPKLNDTMIKGASMIVAINAISKKGKDITSSTKDSLKEFSRAYDEGEKDVVKKKPNINIHGDEIVGIIFIIAMILVVWKSLAMVPAVLGLISFLVCFLILAAGLSFLTAWSNTKEGA